MSPAVGLGSSGSAWECLGCAVGQRLAGRAGLFCALQAGVGRLIGRVRQAMLDRPTTTPWPVRGYCSTSVGMAVAVAVLGLSGPVGLATTAPGGTSIGEPEHHSS